MIPSVLAHESGVLAHQGGWDELALIAGPALLLYLGLRWWNTRGSGDDDAAPDTADPDRGSD